MKELLSILVVVGGGLGTFLLGMKHLSEGLQAVTFWQSSPNPRNSPQTYVRPDRDSSTA